MAKLKIKIDGDAKGVEGATRKAKGALGGLKSSLAAFASGPLIVFAAMAVAIRKVSGALGNLSEKLDGIGKSSKRIGITAEEFQNIAFAARRTGASTETVERAFKRMQKTITDAGKGLRTAKDALNALGLEYDDIKNKSPEKQFTIIGERLNLIKDATTRVAIAQELFGRAGTNIGPLIAEYQELKKELQDLNGIVGDDAVRASEEYQDSIENLSTAWDALIANTGSIRQMANAMEGLNEIVKNFNKNVDDISFIDVAKQLNVFTSGGTKGAFEHLAGVSGFGQGTVQYGQVLDKDLRRARDAAKEHKKISEEVARGIAGFTPSGGVSAGRGAASAIGRDSALSVGQMLTPLASLAVDPVQTELQKQTQILKNIDNKTPADPQLSMFEQEIQNVFKDGA